MSKTAKKNAIVKIFCGILVASMLLLTANVVFAGGSGPVDPSTLTGTYNETSGITTLGQQIIGIITTIGIVVSVVVLVILGIKYMIGSAEEKAEYKKTMIPYIIGAILVFAASTIASIVMSISKNISTSSTP